MDNILQSLPAWGVWIEISRLTVTSSFRLSLPAWGVWIEIKSLYSKITGRIWSLPAWGVWIEIS